MPCSLSVVHQAHIVSRVFREVASELLAPPCPHEGVCLFKGIGAELALQIGTVGHLAVLYDALPTELEIARSLNYYPRPTCRNPSKLDLGLKQLCTERPAFCDATIPSDVWGQPEVSLSGDVVAPGEAGSSEGARFGVDCSGNRRAQASRIVDSMLKLERHMVDLTDLRDIVRPAPSKGRGSCGAGCAAIMSSGMANHALI